MPEHQLILVNINICPLTGRASVSRAQRLDTPEKRAAFQQELAQLRELADETERASGFGITGES